MNAQTLYDIFSREFNLETWHKVLTEVFGATNIFRIPVEIPLSSNDKAVAAYELGNFTTKDERVIGFYRVVLKPNVWLERNKVGLRQLLRSVYKYDVDGAIIVFDQDDKWRLSYVSEIKTLDEQGNIIDKITEPKRYTYLLGKGQKVKTPAGRLSKLIGKPLALKDIEEAFSVEALNKEFYKMVADHFYRLVGGTVKTKGKKTIDYGEGLLKLPVPKEGNQKLYQEFTVRLIGRIVFAWFLKMKKSGAGIPLLPGDLLSSEAVKKYPNYYHNILERLFFQILNTPKDNRLDNLPEGAELIPFLNGGLFEPVKSLDYFEAGLTGFSMYINTLTIPDEWFLSFFSELEKYNFTIDENSTVDIEISVDPEMLGRIFENLLAEIDPDTGETARKASGSYYTPREIVDYMATESLTQYLHNQTDIDTERLRPLFKFTEEQIQFTDDEKEKILDALDKVKVLDPACGSGAFPMGVLHKIITALQKLDPDAEWWKQRQLQKEGDKSFKEKLQTASVEYIRKIGLIKNSLYGVDIQPIATEISKLRAFLSLVVDETIDDTKQNRGIEPLPNLEFKFVTANTLIKLPEEKQENTLFGQSTDLINKLQALRNAYLQSYGEEKERIKQEFLETQKQIWQKELDLWKDKKNIDTNSRAYKLSTWNPFSYEPAEWFDPEWMFGIKEFDIVIGNPPYGIVYDSKFKEILEDEYSSFIRNNDIYIAFYHKGINLLKKTGLLTFITPNTFRNGDYFKNFRKFVLNNGRILKIIDFKNNPIFIDPTVFVAILIFSKKNGEMPYTVEVLEATEKNIDIQRFQLSKFTVYEITDFPFKGSSELLEKLKNALKITYINNLFLVKDVGFNYWSKGGKKNRSNDNSIGKRVFYSGQQKNVNDIKYLKGHNIEKYKINEPNNFLIYNYRSKLQENDTFRFSPKFLLKDEKIVYRQTASSIIAAIDKNKFLCDKTVHIIIPKQKEYSLKYLLALLNSKLYDYLYKYISQESKGRAFSQVKTTYIKKLPVKLVEKYTKSQFETLVDYIMFLKSHEENINEKYTNEQIAKMFEDVIDAMVMELYFEEEFHKKDLYFIRYAERDFEPIENLENDEEKAKVILQAYEKLMQPDNEIRRNMAVMEERLPDIVKPIMGVK